VFPRLDEVTIELGGSHYISLVVSFTLTWVEEAEGERMTYRDLEERDERNKERFTRLFDEPDHAKGILYDALRSGHHQAKVTSILLDNATIDHAFRYFFDAKYGWGEHKSLLPTRGRLMLLAVAEFINALILYDSITIGPGWNHGYGEDPLKAAQQVIKTTTETLAPQETFALLSVAKVDAIESVRAHPALVQIAQGLIEAPLEPAEVLRQIQDITPEASFLSPHYLTKVVSNEKYYYDDFSLGVLEQNEIAFNAVDHANAGKYIGSTLFPLNKRRLKEIPAACANEYFIAHLIYRTHVYLLMADLLGCTYSSDALRSPIVAYLTDASNSRNPFGSRKPFGERLAELLTDAQQTRDEEVNKLLGYPVFSARIPLVFKYVLSKAQRPSEILGIALETRETGAARRFRAYCAEVDEAIISGRRDLVEQALAKLSAYGIKLEAQLGTDKASTASVAVDAAKELVSVGSPLLGALIPGLKLGVEELLRLFKRRKFAFVENLTQVPRSINSVEREFEHLWPDL